MMLFVGGSVSRSDTKPSVTGSASANCNVIV